MKKIKYVLLAVLSAITFLFSSTDVEQMNHVVNGPEAYSKNNNSNDYATHKDDTSYETITLPASKAKSSNYSLYKERVTNNGDRFETHNPIEGVDFVFTRYDYEGNELPSNLGDECADDSVQLTAATDNYEDNDSLDSAYGWNTSFYYGVGASSTWHAAISGTINRKQGWFWNQWTDRDFYLFFTEGKGEVNVELSSIPANCDYDLNLYYIPNTTFATVNSAVKVKSSTRLQSQSSQEYISYTFNEAVAIYVEVFSKNDATWDENDQYNLDVRFYANDYAHQGKSIQEAKASGALGCLWVADWKPEGIAPCFANSIEGAETSLSRYNPMVQAAYNCTTKPLTYGKLYLWDDGLKSAIHDIAEESMQSVAQCINEPSYANQRLDIILSGVQLLFSIAGFVINSISLNFIDTFFALSDFVNAFFPPSVTPDKFYKLHCYFRDVVHILGKNSQLANTVSVIEFNYHFYDGKMNWIPQADLFEVPEDSYESDIIPYSEKNSFVLGSIHNIYKQSDIGDLML